MATLTKVAETGDIPPDSGRVVETGGKTLAVFNVGGTFYAMDNTCLHRGGPLGEGELDGTVVSCPWHGWRYDVTTGTNVMNAAIRVGCYPVRIEGSSILVEL
jgi:nitrite reductase/ring-hydroxylating ferredoxin subunit